MGSETNRDSVKKNEKILVSFVILCSSKNNNSNLNARTLIWKWINRKLYTKKEWNTIQSSTTIVN